MKTPSIGRWKSDDARLRFEQLSQELWGDQGLPDPERIDIPTWAGRTRVYRWSGEGNPIVLLHGMGATGLTWGRYVQALQGCDVYAVDTIGDLGNSEQSAVLTNAADLATWLAESLGGAGIERAHLVGTSYGGYLALNLATRAPERVASLTLIDAAGLAPFRLARFMLWGLPNLVGSKAPERIRRWLARTRPLLEDRRLMKLALLGQTNHTFGLPQPVELTDDELRSVAAPTAVIVAGRSAPFDPVRSARRAALIERAVVDVVPGAGHDVMWSEVDRCVAHLRRHLATVSDA